MTEPGTPSSAPRPSARSLWRSTLIAMAVAGFLLVIAVLPAEYGVDPTGIGRLLGLTEMGEIKMALAREAEGTTPALPPESLARTTTPTGSAPTMPTGAEWRDVTTLTLAPGQGREVKLRMQSGEAAEFRWVASGGAVNFDLHGDATTAPRQTVRYQRGTSVTADSGTVQAAMTGAHGWFFRNRGTSTVQVTLETRGSYATVSVVP